MNKTLTDEDDQYNGNARHTYLTDIYIGGLISFAFTVIFLFTLDIPG